MPLKPVINVKCPCCHHVLEVDVEKERVVSHRKGAHLRDDRAHGEDELDVAVRQQRESRSRIESEFSKAQENLKNQKQRLDDLFRQAKEKAEREKQDPIDPSDPFQGNKLWD